MNSEASLLYQFLSQIIREVNSNVNFRKDNRYAA